MMRKFSLKLLLLVASLPLAYQASTFKNDNNNDLDAKDYTNHKVLRLLPRDLKHVEHLLKLEQDFQMDYWNPVLPDLRSVLTIIDPEREHFFLSTLNRTLIPYEIVTTNYQSVVDREREEILMKSKHHHGTYGADYDYENSYHTYNDIVAQFKYLAQQNPSIASYSSIGNSYEKREIPSLRITKNSNAQVIILECGIHAREWITVSFGTWVANQLLTNSALDSYLQNYQFIIVPVLNVDGYVYTHTSNRLWRKTRSKQSGTTCVGADANRNWDSAFCEKGASNNPCSETYCGRAAFSEVEAVAMSKVISANKGNIAAYFAVHSYSQLWMYPWGYKYDSPPNASKLKQIAQAGVAAIKAVNGLKFTEGTIANTIYLASGSSADWAYDTQGVKIAYAIELRDTGKYGFQLPTNQIKPAVQETWAGLKAAIDKL